MLINNNARRISVNDFIVYAAAFWILVHAVISVIRAFRSRRIHKQMKTRVIGRHWWLELILGMFLCAFAVLSMMNPGVLMDAIGTFLGPGIAVAGVNLITVGLDVRE